LHLEAAASAVPVHLLPTTRVAAPLLPYVSHRSERQARKKKSVSLIDNPPPGRSGYTTWRRACQLVRDGYAVLADGEALRPGCLLVLVDHPVSQPVPLPPGPDAARSTNAQTVSHGDGLGGTAYSSDHATATNPQGVWYLKHLLARERWLFQLSVVDNLREHGA
jgi:hypothetical protein